MTDFLKNSQNNQRTQKDIEKLGNKNPKESDKTQSQVGQNNFV